jgi:hypothetical protein
LPTRTCLFLRYLTNDIPAQADAVEQLLHRAPAGEIVLAINRLVVAEVVWTLESYYGLSRDSSRICFVCGIDNPIGLDGAPSGCTCTSTPTSRDVACCVPTSGPSRSTRAFQDNCTGV